MRGVPPCALRSRRTAHVVPVQILARSSLILCLLTMDSLLNSLDLLKDKAQDAVLALTSCICQSSATIKVNGRSYKIIRILGEGGFSFVYLAQDEHSGVWM